MEKDLFNPMSLVLTRSNISKREQNALKEIKSWNHHTINVQDKGSRFAISENTNYKQKTKIKLKEPHLNKLHRTLVNNWK